MTSRLVIEDRLVEVLGYFGEPMKVLEEAVTRFAAEHCRERIAEIKDSISELERKYGLLLDRFQNKIETEEGFAEYVEGHIEKMWESDLMEWEFQTKELARWERILERISKR